VNGAPPLVDRLETAAREGGGLVVFHNTDGTHRLDAALLFDMALRRASVLRARGVGPGDRIGVIGPNAPDWLAWMHATWMCGGTSVGLPIPLRIRDRAAVAEHVDALAKGFELKLVAAEERFAALLTDGLAIDWAEGDDAPPLDPSDLVRIDDDSLARIVPTSGSTSLPKGVAGSYNGTNFDSISDSINAMGFTEVRYLSTSPLAHAGAWMTVHAHFYPWLEVHALSPQRFARDPGELFRLVGPNRIIGLSASSSAMAATLRAVERRPEGVDLSTLASLALSYEMIDPDVIDRLCEVGERFGLSAGRITASYGLSEGGSTRTPLGQCPRIDVVDLDALASEGVARSPAEGAAAKRVVSCGEQSWNDVRLADENGQPVPERRVGEVQFRGAELMKGYVGPGAHEAFDDDGWMHTGDVGYVADGELFITGRIKEVIVQQGKKYHPEDIEWAAAHGAEVPPDQCVAFTPIDAREGEVVVAVETGAVSGLDDVEQAVRAAVMNRVGIPLRAAVFVGPQSLPKASSGKAQRLAARDLYARGELVANSTP
jgi:fatty-acyl-CoA synthase